MRKHNGQELVYVTAVTTAAVLATARELHKSTKGSTVRMSARQLLSFIWRYGLDAQARTPAWHAWGTRNAPRADGPGAEQLHDMCEAQARQALAFAAWFEALKPHLEALGSTAPDMFVSVEATSEQLEDRLADLQSMEAIVDEIHEQAAHVDPSEADPAEVHHEHQAIADIQPSTATLAAKVHRMQTSTFAPSAAQALAMDVDVGKAMKAAARVDEEEQIFARALARVRYSHNDEHVDLMVRSLVCIVPLCQLYPDVVVSNTRS